MAWTEYFSKAVSTLEAVAQSQRKPIEAAAGLLVDAVVNDKALFAFGATHSFILAEELVYRTGGLALINPIYPHGMNHSVRPMTMTSQLERLPDFGRQLLASSPAAEGDVVILASTSGRNAVAIDMALEARDRGITVVGITSLDYSRHVESRHPSGKKVMDLCDVTIDNGVPYGDAVVKIEGLEQPTGPLSTVTGCAIVNALVAEVVARLIEQGRQPPVFMSANLDGGDEWNARVLSENSHRIHYMH